LRLLLNKSSHCSILYRVFLPSRKISSIFRVINLRIWRSFRFLLVNLFWWNIIRGFDCLGRYSLGRKFRRLYMMIFHLFEKLAKINRNRYKYLFFRLNDRR
jgi:hypothetical protein